MSDEQQPPPGDEDNQQPTDGVTAPVPRRPRRVRGYPARGEDLSRVNANLPEQPVATQAAETGNHPGESEAATPVTPADGAT